MVMRLPAKTIAQKLPAISCQEKMAFPTPHRVVLGLPLPRVCTGGRTLMSQPKFLGSIGYQICLAMELRYKLKTHLLGDGDYPLLT